MSNRTAMSIANGGDLIQQNAAADAVAVQDACNLVAIVGCFHRHLLALHRSPQPGRLRCFKMRIRGHVDFYDKTEGHVGVGQSTSDGATNDKAPEACLARAPRVLVRISRGEAPSSRLHLVVTEG